MERSLRNRLTFGPIMLAALAGLLWLDYAAQKWTVAWHPPDGIGGIGLLILLLIILPPAVLELAAIFAVRQLRAYRLIAIVGTSLLALHAFAQQFTSFAVVGTSSLAFIVVSVMLLAALRRALVRESREAIHHMAGTVLATLYLGGLAWFLVALRVKDSTYHKVGTTSVILLILLSVKATDIGAFFGGRALGRHKLIPWLSPGKTWEGLICGMLTAGIVGAVCAAAMSSLIWWKGFIFGVAIGGVGQLGDLLESMMKRDAEIKDSGSLIPGFGGILDVIDSPLLAAPFAYLLFSLL